MAVVHDFGSFRFSSPPIKGRGSKRPPNPNREAPGSALQIIAGSGTCVEVAKAVSVAPVQDDNEGTEANVEGPAEYEPRIAGVGFEWRVGIREFLSFLTATL